MNGLIEGRIVHYVVTDSDANAINRRRVTNVLDFPGWPSGAQAHVGNPVMAGEHFPAIVVRVFPKEFGDEPGVNLQVFLDGNDTLWVTSARFSDPEKIDLGTCHWPERA